MSAVMGLAALLVPLLFGSHYRAAIPVLMLLSAAIPVRFVAFAYGAAFSSEEHMKRSVWYLGAAALSCIIWSLLLIPPFGINGAALATVLAEVTLLAFYRWGVERHVAAVDVQMTFRVASMRAAVAYIEEAGAGKW
jgi:O-antigen/teichoic acid export membrane protein